MSFDQQFDGYCPECALGNHTQEMSLDRGDLLECPQCRLLICLPLGGQAVILRRRGNGRFRGLGEERYAGSRYALGFSLLMREHPTKHLRAEEDAFIGSEDELGEYLAEVVGVEPHA